MILGNPIIYVNRVSMVNNGGLSMKTRRLTRSMTKKLQEDLELEDQVLTIISTWKPSHIGVPLACNLLNIDLHL